MPRRPAAITRRSCATTWQSCHRCAPLVSVCARVLWCGSTAQCTAGAPDAHLPGQPGCRAIVVAIGPPRLSRRRSQAGGRTHDGVHDGVRRSAARGSRPTRPGRPGPLPPPPPPPLPLHGVAGRPLPAAAPGRGPPRAGVGADHPAARRPRLGGQGRPAVAHRVHRGRAGGGGAAASWVGARAPCLCDVCGGRAPSALEGTGVPRARTHTAGARA